MTGAAYVNGEFVDRSNATVAIDDRGFIFADGVYEVIRCYGGHPFRLADHIDRMRAGAAAVRLDSPLTADGAENVVRELLERNDAASADAGVYIQVTRGAGARGHAFPTAGEPTVVAWLLPAGSPDAKALERGIDAITVPDRRWSMCNVKTTGLLLNVLARQEAVERGAAEALFVRDDVITEGAVTNFLGVLDGRVVTHPDGPFVLPGITRTAVADILAEQGEELDFTPIETSQLPRLEEAFIAGTGVEVLPVCRIDGRPVGNGAPGPKTTAIIEAFREIVLSEAAVR
jgi:D-alanine transaminase